MVVGNEELVVVSEPGVDTISELELVVPVSDTKTELVSVPVTPVVKLVEVATAVPST